MASRRHHHYDCLRHQNHHHNNIPLVATSSLCCTYGDSIPCCTQSNHSSPPPDNLLHLVASYLQNQQQETKCSCESPYQSFNVIRRQHQKKNVPQSREYDHVVLSCLLRKIDDLESSLEKFSASYEQRRDRHSTLRDSAARVIQTHFRSYLVRRSVSFRYLKELASIKSSFLSLKSSISGKSIFPFKAVSRRATDLLLQLDSIQGRIDPMIRNSKRSLSRDLVRFLQYVDDCAMRRCEFVAKSTIDVRFKGSRNKLNGKKPQDFGVAEDRTIEKLRNRMGKIVVSCSEDEDSNAELEEMTTDDCDEVQMNSIDMRNSSSESRIGGLVKGNLVKHPVKRCVVMDKNRNVHQGNGNTDDLSSSEEEDSVDVGEETLVMSRVNGVRHGLKTRNGVLVKGSGGKTTRMVKKFNYDKNGNLYMVYVDKNDLTSSAEDDSGDGDDEILVTCGDDERRQGSETRKRVLVKGSGGKASQVVKTVRFDEKGNIYKVYGDTPESSINEGDDSTNGSNNGNGEETKNTNEIEQMIYVPKQNENFEEGEEEKEETHSENEVSSSEGSERYTIDTKKISQLGSNKDKKEVQHPKGRLMYTPPLPLKMEP